MDNNNDEPQAHTEEGPVGFIKQGSDGRNYDEHLEHLFMAFSRNELTNHEVILGNLDTYTRQLVPDPPLITNLILDNAEMAMRWALKISALHVWELDQAQIEEAEENGFTGHRYGAFLITDHKFHKFQPVTAHNIHNAVLLAVVQRYREILDAALNPVRPKGTQTH